MKKIRILSIDGGGIRGILPGTILSYIEGELKKVDKEATIGKYFDFIAGTSTGGILALLYLFADENGKYKYTANEALNLYLNHGNNIFDVSLRKKITSVSGLIDEKYSEKELEKALTTYLKNDTISQLLKPSLVTSYDMGNRKTHFFTSHDAVDDINNFYLKDVARATSAAPTYFEPAKIKSLYGILRQSISMLFNLDDRFSLNIVAENGKELIVQLTEKIVNVVILDIRMPVLNGIKKLEIIKEKHPEIKVVIFSSQSDHLTVQTARRIGANSFVDKHSHELLIDTVIQVYNEHYSYNTVFQPEI